jgi:RNA polymerase sigma factor (sigma-70 family)
MKPDPMSVYNFAKKYAKRYIGLGVPYEDLVNTAMVGVLEACIRFNPEKGALTTFAAFYMTNELNRACYKRVSRGVVRRFTDNDSFELLEFKQSNYSGYDDFLADVALNLGNCCDSYDETLQAEVNLKVNILCSKLSKRENSAFLEYYQTNELTNYKQEYNSTEAQARKFASNVKVKIYKQIKELI